MTETNDERAKFEAWCHSEGFDAGLWIQDQPRCGYADLRVADYWTGFQARASLAVPPEAPREPVAWIRFCSDGTYEGPLMHRQIDDVRKKSGAWTPLYAVPVAAPMKEPDRYYEPMFSAAVRSLAEISEALGIPDAEAATCNGNELILECIEQLHAASANTSAVLTEDQIEQAAQEATARRCYAVGRDCKVEPIPGSKPWRNEFARALLSHLRTAPLEQRELSDEQIIAVRKALPFTTGGPYSDTVAFARALLAASAAPQQQPEQPNTEMPHLAQVSGEASTARGQK